MTTVSCKQPKAGTPAPPPPKDESGSTSSPKNDKKSTPLPIVCNTSNEPPNYTIVDGFKNITNIPLRYVPGNLIPDAADGYIGQGENRYQLNQKTTSEALNDLPRKSNGEIDTDKIKKALKIAKEYIIKQNEEALKALEMGIYKESIECGDLRMLIAPPEINKALEHLGILPEESENIKLRNNANQLMHNLADDLSNTTGDIADMTLGYRAESIKQNILIQNSLLNALENIELNNDEDITGFLKLYKKATNTSFSYDAIVKASESSNKQLSEGEIRDLNVKAFGMSANLTSATQNKIQTEAEFATTRLVLSKAIGKIGPIGKIIGSCMPTAMLAWEKATCGAPEGKFFNKENFTLDNACDVIAQGAVEAAIANFSPKIGEKSSTFITNTCNKLGKSGKFIKKASDYIDSHTPKFIKKLPIPAIKSGVTNIISESLKFSMGEMLVPGTGIGTVWAISQLKQSKAE